MIGEVIFMQKIVPSRENLTIVESFVHESDEVMALKEQNEMEGQA